MKGFCSVFLATDRLRYDSIIASNGSHPYLLKRTIYTEHTAQCAEGTVPDGRYSVQRIIRMTDYMHLFIYIYPGRLYFALLSVFIFHLYFVIDFSSDYDDLLRLILTLLIMPIMFYEPYLTWRYCRESWRLSTVGQWHMTEKVRLYCYRIQPI